MPALRTVLTLPARLAARISLLGLSANLSLPLPATGGRSFRTGSNSARRLPFAGSSGVVGVGSLGVVGAKRRLERCRQRVFQGFGTEIGHHSCGEIGDRLGRTCPGITDDQWLEAVFGCENR